jgi:8-oxo-dGTP pyrophosphatase MutT (NUDIX family)
MSKRGDWTLLDQREVYGNPWISVTEHQVLNPAGGPGIYGVVHFRNLAIGILAVEENGDVWLVGQHRFPLDAYSWEIPEGGAPLAEDPLTGARRELKEETGIEALTWREIGRLHLSNSVSDEAGIIYLATDLRHGQAEPEETEALRLRRMPAAEAYRMATRGELTDSLTVTGLYRLRLMALEGELPAALAAKVLG